MLLVTCIALGLCGSAAAAGTPDCPLSAAEVVQRLAQRNLERVRDLPAFRSTRTYHTSYRGFPGAKSASMVVELQYTPPGAKQFAIRSQSGSKMLINRVFLKLLEAEMESSQEDNRMRGALNDANYFFEVLACETSPRGPAYVLSVVPKVKSKLLYVGKIWVDASEFAVTRISGSPAKNPSFWVRKTQIEQVYDKVDAYWLPASNRSVSSVRLGGHAELTIEYGEYRFAPPPEPAAAGRGSQPAPEPAGQIQSTRRR